MIDTLVRMQSWVTPQQKEKVRREARKRASRSARKVTESEIIRSLIDALK